MNTRSIVVAAIGLYLAAASIAASAGGASSAAVGPNSIGATMGGTDGGGRLTKLNQYSVKSYTLMRQLVTAPGVKNVTPAESPPAAK